MRAHTRKGTISIFLDTQSDNDFTNRDWNSQDMNKRI